MDKRWLLKGLLSQIRPMHYPRLPIRLVKFLDESIDSETIVFEFGSGLSSLYFDKRCWYWGVEHDPRWHKKVGLDNVTLTQDYKKYVFFPFRQNLGQADFVIIDGIWRNDVLRTAEDYVKDGGYIILDDANRSEYRYYHLDKKYKSWTFAGLRMNSWNINSKGYFEQNTAKMWKVKHGIQR